MFILSEPITQGLQNHLSEFLLISRVLIQNLISDYDNNSKEKCLQILNNYIKYFKESKRKLEFINKFIEGENLETVFDCLDVEPLKEAALKVCESILFPKTKASFYFSFLKTLIREDSADKLIEEKGDANRSVFKIMSVLFAFPSGRTSKDPNFLQKFIDTFVSCYKSENQMIFSFYIMCVSLLNMEQDYLIPTTKMSVIQFGKNDEKLKRHLFLNMIKSLLNNDVDVNVRLTDTLGEKITKLHVKKNFLKFLETVILNQLKIEGKPDKTSLQIITIALKLDPVLIEKKIDTILPPIMLSKKNNDDIASVYITMLNCLLETLFKLGRGTTFLNQILPHLKLLLESKNTDQFELKMRLKDAMSQGLDCNKILSKIIEAEDVFPQKCLEKYGQLTSELMFRQSGELLLSLQKDFEEHCLLMLHEGYVSKYLLLYTLNKSIY